MYWLLKKLSCFVLFFFLLLSWTFLVPTSYTKGPDYQVRISPFIPWFISLNSHYMVINILTFWYHGIKYFSNLSLWQKNAFAELYIPILSKLLKIEEKNISLKFSKVNSRKFQKYYLVQGIISTKDQEAWDDDKECDYKVLWERYW